MIINSQYDNSYMTNKILTIMLNLVIFFDIRIILIPTHYTSNGIMSLCHLKILNKFLLQSIDEIKTQYHGKTILFTLLR